MAEGKFSHPRNHREEDRQIEEAFRQVAGRKPDRRPRPAPRAPEETINIDQILSEAETVVPDVPPTGQPEIPVIPEAPVSPEPPVNPEASVPQNPAPAPRKPELHIPHISFFPEDEAIQEEEEPDAASALPDDADWMDKAMNFFTRNRKQVLLGLCAGAVVLLISIIAAIFMGSSDPYDGKILSNVYLGSVNVGGMTKSQASSAMKAVAQAYSTNDMVVTIGGKSISFAPGLTGARLDVKSAVNAAYTYGRTGTLQQQQEILSASRYEEHVIGLLPYLELDTDVIRAGLRNYAEESGSSLTQTAYGLEGVLPELSTDKFDPNTPGETLVITLGTPGTGFDADAVYNEVLDAYSLVSFQVSVEDVTSTAEPDPLDLEKVYEELYLEPVDASIDPKTFKPVPGTYGRQFDLEQAKVLLEHAQYGDVVRIPMTYPAPEIADDNVYFRDVLGEYRTKHTSNDARNTNLRIACQTINGLKLNPGETFSFNDTLGERTTAKGYRPAPAYSGDDLVDVPGGGICQVSSTLYCAAMISDLEIVSRTNHGFPASYIPYGLDATVSWGSPDLKIRNSTAYPIQLEAEVADGYVTVRILGTDNRGYYVKLEYKITDTQEPGTEYVDYEYDNEEGYHNGDVIKEGVKGYTVKTYRVKYDNQSDRLMSRDFETTTQYKSVKWQIARVAPAPTEAPTVAPTVPPTVPAEIPTTPPTVPPETQAPTQAPEPEPAEVQSDVPAAQDDSPAE